MLRHEADRKTLLYMAAATGVLVVQWTADRFDPFWFAASLVLAFAVSVMHHNHQHQPLWRAAWLNHATDFWFTLFQGHPGFAFGPAHVGDHHAHRNAEHDTTRTWRWGDGNSLLGFIAHPALFACAVAPLLGRHVATLWRTDRHRVALVALHYAVLAGAVGLALWADRERAILFVVIPQAAALFFLLGANYLQHAHADDLSRWNHSRDFLGWINPLFFNIGLHTAHHEHGDAHWSELPRLHAQLASRLDPRLVEPSLLAYGMRVFVAGAFVPALRSRSLRGRTAP
ncbi:MAG: fatty acid desaturase [Ramlibacter sp.]